MGHGTVNIRLRPIKLAFLVNPNDEDSLLKAIEINTFLWGGRYNPIIPTYKEIPAHWEDRPSKNLTSQDVAFGYLDNFDPDYVVPMGECSDYPFDVGNRRKIDDVEEILEPVKQYGTPMYGIGLFEVLSYFIDRELKFQRKHPLEVCIPRFGTDFHPFLAGVFGILSENIDNIFWDNFAVVLEAKKIDCSDSNYAEILKPENLFLRRMTNFYLKSIPSRPRWGQCVFLLDASKLLDIMDYWNLRAIGWDVIPVPKQFARFDKTKQLILNFIEQNYVPHHANPEIFQYTTILKSRSISKDEHKHFVDSLDISRPDENHRRSKVSVQSWYPRIWNEWARRPDHVECCNLEADAEEHDISTNEEIVRFKTLDPKFTSRFGGHGEARFANEIDLRLYDDKELFAEVVPEGDRELARVIGGFGLRDWRLSRKGPVYLSRHSKWTVSISLPQAEAVVIKWLESKEWRVELSPAGHIAKQMIRQLGGKGGTGILARKAIIELLNEINSKQKQPILAGTLWQRTKAIAEQIIPETANLTNLVRDPELKRVQRSIIQQLTRNKVLQIGMKIQCPECTKHSWYSVKSADYELQCSECLAEFSFPSESEEVKWSYRTLGPFSSTNQADGAYTVLLMLRFFSDFSLLGGATTPLTSFKAKRDGIELEADLALFFQASKFEDSKTEVIFAECKTFIDFQKNDADKMGRLGEAFPGAVLVFATLKESLSNEEKAILCPLVNRCREYWKNERPVNPVLILTGTELFAEFDLAKAWEDAGGLRATYAKRIGPRDLLELCDITQQVYLGMDSWHQWLDEQREAQFRQLCAARGLNWDTMTETERQDFVDDLVHEDRE
ncbi:MAG: hypothetical protein OXP71_04405 [Candidatus Poribacteria bacterium]|nr:hypothetical protein [Candidatus Poribacteria bacterium]